MESIEALDLGVLYFFGGLQRPGLDDVALFVTRLGNPWPLFFITTVWVFVLSRLRPGRGRLLAGLGASSALAHFLVKLAVARPRPDVAFRLIDVPITDSFPSGHAFSALAIYLGGAVLTAPVIRNPYARSLFVAVMTTVGLAVGMTRPYLGVHYPGDVLAGWIGGLGWAYLWLSIDARRFPGGPEDPPLARRA